MLVFPGGKALAQAFIIGHLYTDNKYAYNPAYAGEYGKPVFFLTYRKVASAISGTPESISFGGSATIYKNMALGGRIYRQSEGLFNTILGFADYSYQLKLDTDQYLRFGISAGVNANKIDYSEIIAEDPSAISEVASKSFEGVYFESAAGIAYQWSDFELGVAVPKIFSTKGNFGLSVNSFVQYTYRLEQQHIGLSPSLFVYYNQPGPLLFDAKLLATWKQKFWLGAGYRNRPSLVLHAGVNLGDVELSYASELSIGKYSTMFNQIHELSVSYSIRKKKRVPTDTTTQSGNNYLALKDSLTENSIKIAPVVVNETDHLNDNNEGFIEDEFTEAEETIALIEPLSPENNFYEIENETTQNSGFEINGENEDYEMVEIGDGIFSIKSNSSDNSDNEGDMDEAMLDSLLNESDLFEKAMSASTAQNTDGAYYHAVYYTIKIKITDGNKQVLTNPEIVDKARIETTKDGIVSYYYGYFSRREEAERQQKRLSKFDISPKVLKFNAYK